MANTEVAEHKTRALAPAIAPPRLPYHPALQERFGVGQAEWRALVDAVFPLAKETSSIILALSYCRARNLDPFKKPIHIVPMWNSAVGRMVETVWPGIGELRTTAFRTGQYAGRDEARYGETITRKVGSAEVEFPEWCQVTVYRLLGGQRLPFPGPRVYWLESYAVKGGKDKDQSPNEMWRRRPFGQLDKCAEAAALRAAFPEEVGNEYAAEEMEGRTIDGAVAERMDAIAAPKTLAGRLDALAGVAADPETGEVLEEEHGAATAQDEGAAAHAESAETAGDAAADGEARGEARPAAAESGERDLFAEKSMQFRFGYLAFEQGVPRNKAPSDLDPNEATEWENGWDQAKEASSGKKQRK
jgi:phage recombination protein Bet